MTTFPRAADSPSLDARELRWAAQELAALARQVEPGSVVGVVLQQALRELTSLKQSAEGAGAMRIPVAA